MQLDGEKPKEQASDVSDNVNDQAPLLNVVDRDRLLFSAFSLLQKLGADERPEVGKHVLFNERSLQSMPIFSQFASGIITNVYTGYTNLKECELVSRLEIQRSGHFFRHLEVMGKSFRKACGRIAFGITFFLH